MSLVLSFSDTSPGGTAGSPKTGDLSGSITAGSTNALILIKNTGEEVCNFNWREIGTTEFIPLQIPPSVSQVIPLSLTAARTFEYYFDISSISVYASTAWGTSATASSVTLSSVEDWLTMYGYTISASGDMTSAQVQLCLDRANSEVTMASTRYALIAMQTLNSDWKNTVIRDGAIAHALRALENKGSARGLEQQSQQVSAAERQNIIASYNTAILKIEAGIFYGA